jgi:hypothetical protein
MVFYLLNIRNNFHNKKDSYIFHIPRQWPESTLSVSKNIPVRFLGTRFTSSISCFEPGPHAQKPQRAIFETPCKIRKSNVNILQGISKNVLVRFLGTRFKARNCISESCPQEPYRDIFFQTPCT